MAEGPRRSRNFSGQFSNQPRHRFNNPGQTTRRPLQHEKRDEVLGRTSTCNSCSEGHRQEHRGYFAGGAGYCAVVAGSAGTRPADGSSRYNVARFSRQAPAGTKVVKQTEYREYDQPVARTIRQAAAAVELMKCLGAFAPLRETQYNFSILRRLI